jgi:predicted MFS family arabinose efflux permease
MAMLVQAVTHRGQGAERLWPAVWLVVGAGVVSAFQVGKAPMALAAIQSDLGLGIAVAALLMSSFALVGALAGAPIGLAVERFGAQRMIAAGLAMQGMGAAIGAFAPAAEMLLAMRVLEGLGFLAVIVAAPPLIYAVAPMPRSGRAMALWATFMPVGMTVIMLASPLLGLLQWRGFWLLNAGILLAYAAAFAAAMGLPRGSSARRYILQDLRTAAATPGPWRLAALFAALSAAFFSVFSFLPILLTERFGIGPDASNIIVGIAIAASGVGNILCGQLLARGVRSGRIVVGSFAVMAACGIGIFAGGQGLVLVCGPGIVLSLASGFVPVVVFHEAPNQTINAGLVGVTIGMAMQGNNLGLLVGPAVAGSLAAAFGWPSVAAWMALICLAAMWMARTFLVRRDA